MKKLQKNVCFIVLVLIIAGTMTTLIRVRGSSTFSGTIKDCSDNPISGAGVVLTDCYFNILGFDATDSAGDYSFIVALNDNSPYYLTASKTRFNTGMKLVYSGGTNDFDLVGNGEKIAVFIWTTDVMYENFVGIYTNYLGDEGYTTFYYFENSTNLATDCGTVDVYEIDADTIFVYVFTHGDHHDGHSWMDLDPSGTTYFESSEHFRGYLDAWEANKKCLLVDACYAGDFADDFATNPYLAMASSNETTSAYSYGGHPLAWEGQFSHHFFERIVAGDNAIEAYDYTVSKCDNPDQYPKKQDYSNYNWFD
ncbi:MAG: carboxypeptidase regulatory-like domain-containing protein [Candidatus Heimdallarchaeota archaeon]|nr:carboxypeptidase regulatory-like domain-containing protein [Candidatus Heimdallarchaeota archaeon]